MTIQDELDILAGAIAMGKDAQCDEFISKFSHTTRDSVRKSAATTSEISCRRDLSMTLIMARDNPLTDGGRDREYGGKFVNELMPINSSLARAVLQPLDCKHPLQDELMFRENM